MERLATEITALGTRQVGEVQCTIDNPDHELVPGTNINAFIETTSIAGALTVPKEAIRRDGNNADVYVLEGGDTVRRKRIGTGASSVTRTQVTNGLTEQEPIALATDKVLKDGDKVKPIF